MINKILRKDYPDLFKQIIDDEFERSYEEHRRGSNFYVRSIFWIDEEYFPDFPKWWGFWESNTYIWDSEYGSDDEIYELNRVEKKEVVVTTYEWMTVKDEIAENSYEKWDKLEDDILDAATKTTHI